jgi:type VI secretion system protein ImpA
MPTSPVLDIAELLHAVSDEAPAGPELRHGSKDDIRMFLAVRDARKKAIDAERRMRDFASMSDEERSEVAETPESPDWAAVYGSALEALGRSKDLWVTAWLIEAVTRLHGFAGLRDGVTLAHQLCETFWADVHPQPEVDQDMTTRFAQFAGLDGGGSAEGTLIVPLMDLPLTAPRTIASFSLAEYRDALELERKPPEIRSRRLEQGALSVALCDQAVAETGMEFFRTRREDLEGALKAYSDFIGFLKEREVSVTASGGVAFVPPSSKIRDVLDECMRLCRAWGPKEPLAGESGAASSPDSKSAGSGADAGSFGGNVQTRQEAFEALLRVAEYFRKTEPHSPVSYALEQVVRWGRMSLPELLSELVSDTSAREAVFLRTGIKVDSSGE